MLWSLFKIILFVVLIGAATFGAAFLLETNDGISVQFGSQSFTLGALQTVIALVVLMLLLWAVLRLAGLLVAVVRFLNGDETAISRHFHRNRERKGYQALSDGMMALASGEERLAMTKAAQAERYLRKPELTNLITAQAAEMAGDQKKATQVYKRLLSDERTRFVGVRGLMKQKLAEGDTETAMKLAEKAFTLKPRHTETQDILLALQATQSDWTGARNTLKEKVKQGALPKDVGKRREAVLALQEAKDIFEDGNSIRAREAAIEVNKLSPDLIPGAILAAKSYMEQSNERYAARVLTKAWSVQPHPDLAAAFARIAPDEDAQSRLKRFKKLVKSAPEHAEARLLMAELNIAAEDFKAARLALGDLPETAPTQRSLTLLAAIERGEGAEDATVRETLTKAVVAPRGAQWICDKCHHIHTDWAPICENCDAFDTLSWKTPPESESKMPGGEAMVPFLVGKESGSPDPIKDPDLIEVNEVTPVEDALATSVDPEEAKAPEAPDPKT
ncbi:MAG: heme biosynthesis protein HemY [Maritimibacter sp.]